MSTRASWMAVTLLTLAAAAVALSFGSAGSWWGSSAADGADGATVQQIVRDLRAPRAFGAWLVGALLGIGGALAQAVFRNPLADPYLLGSASGAALGVAVVLALGLSHTLVVSTAAFVGALAAVLLVIALARGVQRPMILLLAGVAVGVVLGAVREALTVAAPQTLRAMQGFMLGTTAFVGWSGVVQMAGVLLAAGALALTQGRALDASTLGDDEAVSLGVRLRVTRAVCIAVLALTTAVAVAHAGLIAFVGLAAPHIARRLGHVRHAAQIVFSALAGGALLLVADVIARLATAPSEWPVGLVTAALGGAYLLWALHRRPRRHGALDGQGEGAADGAQAVASMGRRAAGSRDAPTLEPAAVVGHQGIAMQLDIDAITLDARTVVRDVRVALARGTWTAVVGPNGAGKSTALRAMAGLEPCRGSVTLDGRDLSTWSPLERARTIAWAGLPSQAEGWSVRERVMLGRLPYRGRWGAPSADDERAVDRALRLAQCEHLTARMVDSLSAGERQRVHLARAHAVEARVVLLDEPVAHLDAPHQAQWLESVREATGAGVTIVAVLHDLNLALQADAMWVMGEGTLLAAGAPGGAAVLAAIDRVFGGRMVVHRVDGRLRAWVQ